jgi:serine/threonine protein kinase/Tfp pilus assembly protein PilF
MDETLQPKDPNDPAVTPTHVPLDAALPGAPREQSPLSASIGGYTLVRKLGEGGMGVVYEALQGNPRRAVALKIIRGGAYVDETVVRLFQREVQALARLKHPGIAAIYEAGRTGDGQHFFAMELVQGRRLDEFLASEPPAAAGDRASVRSRLELFLQICDAVAYAHQRGVIHRDLKPSNILVQEDAATGASRGGAAQPGVKVLDFGLARIADGDVAGASMATESGTIRGTVPYMSPEQIRGDTDLMDLRTDVYSLGVILYEMLTGELPYDLRRASLPEAARIICHEPPRLRGRLPGHALAGREIETIVGKALEKDAAQRYQSAAGFAEDIRRYLNNQPIVAQPPSTVYQLRKMVSRHKVGFGFAASLLVLLAVAAGAMTVQARRIALERDRANRQAAITGQVSDFLVRLFRVSRPDQARGATITARELLDKGTAQIRADHTMDPEVRAALVDTMGDVYSSLGLFDRARPLLEEALRTRTQVFGASSLPVADTLHSLGLLLQSRGQDAESKPEFERSLAIYEKREGPASLNVAQILNDLGNAENHLGDYKDAETAYDRAIAIRKEVEGPDTLDVVPMQSNLALLSVRKGDLAGAERAFRAALATYEKALPPNHPDVALLAGNVGATLVAERKYREAEPFYKQALAIHEKVLGDEHPQLALDLANLAEVHRVLGDLPSAESENRRALAILRAKVPPTDFRTRFVLVNLATVLDEKGAPAGLREAEGLLREVIATNRTSPPPDPWDAAKAEGELGGCLLKQGKYAAAEPLLVGSFPTLRDKIGINDRARVDNALDWIIELYRREGKPAKAAPYLALRTARHAGEGAKPRTVAGSHALAAGKRV